MYVTERDFSKFLRMQQLTCSGLRDQGLAWAVGQQAGPPSSAFSGFIPPTLLTGQLWIWSERSHLKQKPGFVTAPVPALGWSENPPKKNKPAVRRDLHQRDLQEDKGGSYKREGDDRNREGRNIALGCMLSLPVTWWSARVSWVSKSGFFYRE